jgi:hypothetical protein
VTKAALQRWPKALPSPPRLETQFWQMGLDAA